MAYKKKTGGRKIGTPNKFTKEIKDMVLDALVELGGKDYLVQQGTENAASFMTLCGRAMPLAMEGKVKHTFEPLVIKQT